MKKHRRSRSQMPVQSWLIPPIFHFGHVRGIARIFLEVEIGLSVAVVLGTLAIVVTQALQ